MLCGSLALLFSELSSQFFLLLMLGKYWWDNLSFGVDRHWPFWNTYITVPQLPTGMEISIDTAD